MRGIDSIAELTAAQWGMVTTAQAETVGVSRLTLSRLENAGALERLAKGVYKDSGVPSDSFEGLHAAWLSLNPALTAEERLSRKEQEAVVSFETAAWLLDVGDFVPEPYRFSTPKRKQTQRTDIALRTRKYPAESIEIVEGLPVTIVEQTIADLVETSVDLSLIQDLFLNMNFSTMEKLDQNHLDALLAPLARRNGFTPGNGAELREKLMAPLTSRIMNAWGLLLKQLAETIEKTTIVQPTIEMLKSAFSNIALTTQLGEDAYQAIYGNITKILELTQWKNNPNLMKTVTSTQASDIFPKWQRLPGHVSMEENRHAK